MCFKREPKNLLQKPLIAIGSLIYGTGHDE